MYSLVIPTYIRRRPHLITICQYSLLIPKSDSSMQVHVPFVGEASVRPRIFRANLRTSSNVVWVVECSRMPPPVPPQGKIRSNKLQ